MNQEKPDIPANVPAERGGERPGEPGEYDEASGWTTTKQAAKALGVTRRTVQGYVRRGILTAREEGSGVEKTFYVSIDSLNALLDQRREHDDNSADATAKHRRNSPSTSAGVWETANTGEDVGAALRRAIERLEARTAEAASLRTRLELTERSESTLRAERERLLEDLKRERGRTEEAQQDAAQLLEERHKAQEEAGKLREELYTERSKGFFRRLFGR